MKILFQINDELVEVAYDTDDEDARQNLFGDNAHTSEYIKGLARIGSIRIAKPITRIVRFITESEQQVVLDEEIPDKYLVYHITAEKVGENSHCSEIDNSALTDINNGHNCQDLELADVECPDDSEPVEGPVLHKMEKSAGKENSDSNVKPKKKQNLPVDFWNEDETKFMLDQFTEYLLEIGPVKKFKNKKLMWEQIAQDIHEKFKITKSATQIENRYKTVVRRKKDAVVNNSKSGHSRQEVPFEQELTNIAGLDDSIEPAVIRSAKKVTMFKKSQVVDGDTSDESDIPLKQKLDTTVRSKKIHKRKRSSSIADTLRMLNEQREAAKQARHKERLELIRDLFGKK